MRRREFIAGLGSTAAWTAAARSQQPAQGMRRIGVLNSFAESDPTARSFIMETFQALSRLGWESGRNVQIEQRWAAGDIDRARVLAKELVALQPDVILAVATAAATALQRETRTVPIVFLIVADPVGAGFVASLARPGGNITGFSNAEGTLGGKLLTLVKQIAPGIRRAAAMFNPDTAPGGGLYHLSSFEAAARSFAIEPITAQVRSDADIEWVIMSLGREQGGLVVIPDAFMNVHRGAVIALSKRNNVPAIFDEIGFAKDGGLLQYGPNFPDVYRRAAIYVDRILRGAKPSELPVELPVKFDLAVNVKTAKALGLIVPNTILVSADEVIE